MIGVGARVLSSDGLYTLSKRGEDMSGDKQSWPCWREHEFTARAGVPRLDLWSARTARVAYNCPPNPTVPVAVWFSDKGGSIWTRADPSWVRAVQLSAPKYRYVLRHQSTLSGSLRPSSTIYRKPCHPKVCSDHAY